VGARLGGPQRRDGRGYIILLTAPQKFQKDVVAEYERILGTWKWTRR